MNNLVRIAALSKQRGALAVTTPLIVLLIFLLTVLMLDGARLYALKRSMQSVANAAAAAAADATQACAGYEVENGQAIWATAESAALAAGKDKLGGALSLVQPGILTAEGGSWRFKKFDSSVKETNAVKVIYELSAPISSLLPSYLGALEMRAGAVARKEVVATVSAAGSTAIIGGDGETAGLLGHLLGAILTDGSPFYLDPTEVKSLARTAFYLDGFLGKLGVGDLLEAADRLVPVSLILEGILAGLGEGGGAAGDALDRMLAASPVSTNVRLGDVLRSVGAIESPEEVRVPVYDTVVAVLLNTLSGSVLELPHPLTVNTALAESVAVDLHLTVGEPPSVLIAPARYYPDGTPMLEFTAADLILGLRLKVSIPPLADIEVPLLVRTGGGTGYLAYADCAAGMNNQVLLGFELHPEVVTVSTQTLKPDGKPELGQIKVSLLPAVSKLLTVSVAAQLEGMKIGSAQPVQRRLQYDLYTNEPVRASVTSGVGLSMVGEGLAINATVKLGGDECKGLLSWLTCKLGELLNPLLKFLLDDITGPAVKALVEDVVVQALNDATSNIVEPLLLGLGLSLGGMSVDVSHVGQAQVVLLECSRIACEWEDEQ